MEARFKSFKHDNSFYLSKRNSVGIVLFLIFILLFVINQVTNININGWLFFYMILFFFYILFLRISHFISKEKPRGKYNQDLILTKNEIKINNKRIPLSEINKIKIAQFNDRKGKFKWYSHDFEPAFSSGLDNKIILHLKNKKRISTHFLQETNWSLKHHSEILTHYYKAGLLHWLNLIDILKISDYKKIQEFKKQVHSTD